MKLKRSWIPALVVALIALTSGGWLLQQGSGDENGPFFNAQLLEQVHQIVADRYVEEVDPGELYQMAIEGMLHELGDPHSTFLDPEEVEQLKLSTTGNYAGLGIRIGSQDGWITVVSVLPDTPAEKEGLETGDRIVQVEGESAEGWSTTEAVNVLRGEKGSEVTITVGRVGIEKPLKFTVTRDRIHVVAVKSFMLDGGVGYVKLDPFSRNARHELKTAIDGLKEDGASSLILDLRSNPGGLLDEGVAVADLFLPEGAEVVTTRSRVESENETYTAPQPEVYRESPLIVLVDRYSASASEIVAGALQDQDRALIVGTTTFGKGSVQSLFNLPGGNYLKLTTGRWYTPSGRSIQKPHDRESQISQQAVAMGGSTIDVSVDTAGREKYQTSSGRTVYGGGGITPDVIVMPDTLTSREQLLRSTLAEKGVSISQAAFRFGVKWADQHPDLSRGFQVDGSVRSAFRAFLAEELGEEIDEELYGDSSGYVDWLLGRQIANASFGEEAELRRQLSLDSQMSRALALLREAGSTRELFALASERATRTSAAEHDTDPARAAAGGG
jgi:carboxyl-terminal processing protease